MLPRKRREGKYTWLSISVLCALVSDVCPFRPVSNLCILLSAYELTHVDHTNGPCVLGLAFVWPVGTPAGDEGGKKVRIKSFISGSLPGGSTAAGSPARD